MPAYLVIPLIATALLRSFFHHRQAMRRMRLLQHVHDRARDGKCVENIQAMAEALALVADRSASPAGEVLRRVGLARSAAGAGGSGVEDNPGSSAGPPAAAESSGPSFDPHLIRGEDRASVPPPRPPGPGHRRDSARPAAGAEVGSGLPRRRRRAEESIADWPPVPGADIGGVGKVVVMPRGGNSISEFVTRTGHARTHGSASR
jgi:hypothetical protein